MREVYTFMQFSFKRQTQCKGFQQFLDIKPHKLLQPSQTRWLSLISVVKRVLEEYEARNTFPAESDVPMAPLGGVYKICFQALVQRGVTL